MKEKRMKADVLCIGGGPAGLMAAIRAGELGASVIVADKANTLHSGSGSAGNDHFMCYIPEYHGKDIQPIIDEVKRIPMGARRPEFGRRVLEESYDIVKLWDSWGIPMKYKGRWEFAGHGYPGRPLVHLKYTGGNQKRVLTEQALKRGALIVNRVNVFEVLVDRGRAVGALGFDTWNDQIIEFQAKAVFLGTGGCGRLYPASTPGWMFNLPMCPYVTGDGRSMVYRAGGELHDMEHIGQWAGIKYFARAGKATWIGVLRGPDDKPIGPFITKPDRVYGDITSDCWTTVFDDYMKTGKGPVYMDCRGASREDLDYMRHWLLQEGNKGILDNMAEEGIDPGRHTIEFRSYETHLRGGVRFNIQGETSVKGLFAAGQEYFGHMAVAVVFGWLAGENAARYANQTDFEEISTARERAGERVGLIEDILSREEGATWKEANFAVQQIMAEYAAGVRSETLLDQGLLNLKRLREKVAGTLIAGNGHELGRCLEVLSLLDVGEMVMLCARERKETRGNHRRTDYPFTNPLLEKALVLRREGDKPVLEWKEY